VRAPHVPLPRVVSGQQRSLTSPVTEYQQISLVQLRDLNHRPIFQAGHAGSISVARSQTKAQVKGLIL